MQTTERATSHAPNRIPVKGLGRDHSKDFSICDEPTLSPIEHDLEARPARKAAPAAVDRGERTHRLGTRTDVYDEPAPDDWMLVAVGLGMSSSMLALLVMLFSGYGAI